MGLLSPPWGRLLGGLRAVAERVASQSGSANHGPAEECPVTKATSLLAWVNGGYTQKTKGLPLTRLPSLYRLRAACGADAPQAPEE